MRENVQIESEFMEHWKLEHPQKISAYRKEIYSCCFLYLVIINAGMLTNILIKLMLFDIQFLN